MLNWSNFRIAVIVSVLGVILVVWLLWPSAPDFSEIAAGEERKQAFIHYFTPLINKTNTEIQKDRERADALRSKSGKLGFFEQRSLRKLAESYALKEFDDENPQHWNELLKRVNTVPPSLALAQAANESAWGTSRFAQEGNNYFGQWCFERGCGLVPIEQYDR